MWKFIAGLFSNKNVIDNVMSGMDKAWFTNEERAEMQLKFLKAYEPYRLAQRLIALMVTGVWLFSYLAVGVLYATGLEVAEKLMGYVNENMSYPVLMIFGWYFGGAVIQKFAKKDKPK